MFRFGVCIAGVGAITIVASQALTLNATTVGFAYLLLVLIIASTWGFIDAALSSVLSTLVFNFFFLPPVGTFTIADPQNWVALFSFLATALIASRLSAIAKRRAVDAAERQRDVERLYTFSRAILLIDRSDAFAKELITKLADAFELSAAILYDRQTGGFHRAGPSDLEGVDDQLRDAALNGTSFADPVGRRIVTAVRLGSEPIASLALQDMRMHDSVIQGIGNLVAIGLERARAQDLAHQVEAARQSEQLRTTLIDAMAHEFKTPLTVIKGATTSVLAGSDPLSNSSREQLTIADEEAERLTELLDNAVEMARLDTTHIDVHLEPCDLEKIVREVTASMLTQIDDWPLQTVCDEQLPVVLLDTRLMKLATKQLVDNAIKYSPPDTAIEIRLRGGNGAVILDVVDHGAGIAIEDRDRIFERFYRGRHIKNQIPGSGLGLNIAYSIAQAHGGNLAVMSQPGETIFRMTLPVHAIRGGRQ